MSIPKEIINNSTLKMFFAVIFVVFLLFLVQPGRLGFMQVLPFYLCVCIVLLLIAYFSPEVAICILLLSAIFNVLHTPTFFSAVGGIAISLIRKRGKVKVPIKIPLLLFIVFLIGFLIYATLSLILSKDISVFVTTSAGILRWLIFPLSFILFINTIKTRIQLNRIITFFILVVIFAAIFGILQYLVGPDAPINVGANVKGFVFGEHFIRASSTIGHPNIFAGLLLLSLPFMFISYVYKIFDERISLVLFVVLYLALCTTFSMNGLISFWITLPIPCIFLVNTNKKFTKRIIFVVLCLILVTIYFVSPLSQNQITQRIETGIVETGKLGTNSSQSQRIFALQTAFNIIKDHPFLGIGPGNFPLVSKDYAPKGTQPIVLAHHVHNTYLQLWVEMGIFALIIFLWIIYGYTRHSLNRLNKIRDPLIIGSISAISAFLFAGLFDFWFIKNHNLIFPFIMAIPFILVEIGRE